MRISRARRAAGGVLVSLALGLTLAPSADAESLGKARGLEYLRSSVVKSSGGQQVSRQAFCPDGVNAIGGGGSIEGPAKGVTLNETYPDAGMQSWWTAEGTAKGSKKRPLRAWAICSENIPVTYVTEPFSGYGLGSNETVNNLRGCPGQNYPTAGGVSATGAGIEILDNLFLDAGGFPGWSTTVTNPTIDDTVVFFHSACVQPDRPRKVRKSKSKKVAPGEAASVVAECRRGEVVEGGGWRAKPLDGEGARPASVQVTRPWDSADKRRTPEDGWLVRARNSGQQGMLLVGFAGCRLAAD